MADVAIPWAVRQFVYFRAGYRCEHCRRVVDLELHHLRYWTDEGESIRGFETPNDLRALCRVCHQNEHIDPSGAFWADPEEMQIAWETYYSELERG